MKYFVLSKCRLVDKSIYLLPGTIFDPESEDYERSSRSLAAALKAGWIRKATDKDVEKVAKSTTSIKTESIVKPKSELAKGAALGAVDMKPEAFADEVISGDEIIKARDKRRKESTTKTVPEVEVVSETETEPEDETLEEEDSNEESDDVSEDASDETSEETVKRSATNIKKEIEKKVRKRTSKKKKS